MNNIIKNFLFLACSASVFHAQLVSKESDETPNPESSEESSYPQPQERPRLFQPRTLHPNADAHPHRGRSIYWNDPYFGGLSPYASGRYYGHGFGHGYPFGYGFGIGHGMRSHLYWDTFYGMLPAPGETQLTFSMGSNDYIGTSLSTTTYLSKKHNIMLNMGAMWEKGELWWNKQDYESFTIAPTLYWENEKTSIYLGFEYSEGNVAEVSTTPQSRPSLNTTIPANSYDSMSPFRSENSRDRDRSEKEKRGIYYRPHSNVDHTVQSATIGIEHQITDGFRIGLHFDARDFDEKR